MRRNDAVHFKVTHAPRPIVCPLSFCSPSGAFLDALE
jgi:hypothetical protein